MFRKTQFLVTALAGLSLAGTTQAQVQPRPQSGQPGPNISQPAGDPAMRSERTASGQADSMVSQLRQFAQDPKTAPDKLFVLHAGCGNQFEIELSRQVAQKASNPTVKELAQQIMNDHQKAQQQLQEVAGAIGVQFPSEVPEEKQQIIQIMTSLPVDQMEKHYVAGMQADHAMNLIKYRAVAQMSQSDQVTRYVQQTLPALQQHNDHINQAARALGLPTSDSEAVPAAGRLQPGSSRVPANDRTDETPRTPADSRTGTGGRGQPAP